VGSGKGACHVFKAPGQTEEDALRAVGIDTEKDDVIIWTPVGSGFGDITSAKKFAFSI
jgi:hypothetical protein